MYFDADKNDHGLPYNPIKALTVPRPIGWISTISKDGVGNLAPFSYFNGLSYNPPFVMFSGGSREDGTKKDSVLNAEETGEFVFNIATYDTKDKMNDSSWIDDPAVDGRVEVVDEVLEQLHHLTALLSVSLWRAIAHGHELLLQGTNAVEH